MYSLGYSCIMVKSSIFSVFMASCFFLAFNQSYAVGAQYDSGATPAIAKSDNVVVEVHSSGYSQKLWYRVGVINDTKINWGKSYHYGKGGRPKVAIMGNTVVEMHDTECFVGFCILEYRVGELNAETKSVQWGKPTQYAGGSAPSIFLNNNVLFEANSKYHCELPEGGDIDEVYCYSTLIFRMGMVDNENKTIQWFYVNNSDFWGDYSSITVQDDTIVAVFKGGGEHNKSLYYRVGKILGDSINWGPDKWAKWYDEGTRPSLAMVGNTLIEMHSSPYFNRLWYHIGTLNADNTITWGASIIHDRGLYPSIAMDQNSILEVHQSDYFYTLFSSLGTFDFGLLKVNWLNAKQT
jgi:hypothetical protein